MRRGVLFMVTAALVVALLITMVTQVNLRGSNRCSELTNSLEVALRNVISALNYSEPYGSCVSGCTSRFYDAYLMLKDNVTTLINELEAAKCSGVDIAVLRAYINYALGNLTQYNPGNPISGINNALNSTVKAYRLLTRGG